MVIPAENFQEAFDQLSKKPQKKPSFGIVKAVRDAVPHIRQLKKQIPETAKPLRLTMQSNMYGELKYSAESLSEGEVMVRIKILLPPDSEQTFEINLSDEDLISLESLKRNLRVRVFDFVFNNFSKNNGLGGGDPGRIDEIAEDIFETFRLTEK